MNNLSLTDTQLFAIVNALRVAAERYAEDARTMADAPGGFKQLETQFKRQQTDAINLADMLEAQ